MSLLEQDQLYVGAPCRLIQPGGVVRSLAGCEMAAVLGVLPHRPPAVFSRLPLLLFPGCSVSLGTTVIPVNNTFLSRMGPPGLLWAFPLIFHPGHLEPCPPDLS